MMRVLVLLLLIPNIILAQVNLGLGLVAYYPFNGNANDASGNNNNPVFNNATLTIDRQGNPNSAYHFNGTSSYIQVPNSPTLNMTNQMSIAVWVKPLGYYTGTCYNNMLVMKGDADYIPGIYFLRFSDHYTGCTAPTTTEERFYGYGVVADLPLVQLNQWYSVVWTCDGITAKIYVNCILRASIPVSGFTFTNGYDLFLGHMNNTLYPYWLNGVLDEVRIYNRPLNADEVNLYGGCALATGTTIGGIINAYTPVLALNRCENKITVEDGTSYNTGDTVLMIQMKGAVIDSTNTPAFGNITDYRNAGNYEINYVKSKAGNIIELKNKLIKPYDIPDGKVQLVRVPYYQNANVSSSLTCLAWDGAKGGVLVLNAQDTVNLNANIEVSGKGFKGGVATHNSVYHCNIDSFYILNTDGIDGARKGEGIFINSRLLFGRGKAANGGGGGNATNAGGGGGGNGGDGGSGGKQYVGNLCHPDYPNTGIGGSFLTYNNTANRIYLGGGGGAGQMNDIAVSGGGGGGGIVIIITKYLKSNSFSILADGNTPIHINGPNDDGRSGGGGGGTVLLSYTTLLDNSSISAKGGNGDFCIAGPTVNLHGPGGGGGGGVVWINQAAFGANLTTNVTGGTCGTNINLGNNPWGATNGLAGQSLSNLILPITTIPFRPNIDSVRINDSLTTCNSFDFKGFGYTNTSPITTWQWFFGDGGTASSQNTSHSYLTAGTFPVKLVVTDINGCRDSITKNVTSSFLVMDAGPSDTICAPNSLVLQATHTGGTQFAWTPASFLNDPALLNPTATPPITTTFYLVASNASGCSKTDSVTIVVRAASTFNISPASDMCTGESVQLNASGGDLYSWLPAGTLNDPFIANPVASPLSNTTYSVQITDTICGNNANLSTMITILPPPSITVSRSNDIDCAVDRSQLNATGGVSYTWTPSATLSNPGTSNPVAMPVVTTQYVVTVTDASGCTNTDSVVVKVEATGKGLYLMPTAFTPNNDGKNDCYGIKYWGVIQEIDFSIYNRWGERVFHTSEPGRCWDGKYKGQPQDSHVFIYMIRAKTSCQDNIFRKGTFVLIR